MGNLSIYWGRGREIGYKYLVKMSISLIVYLSLKVK